MIMNKKQRGKFGNIILILSAVVALAAALILFFVYTKPGKKLTSKVVAGYLHNAINYVPGNGNTENKTPDEENGDLFEKPVEEIEEGSGEKEYYHILLLGEEARKTSSGNGRTDTIILATIDVKQKRVILTSVLRDSYVEPEGMNPCKINAVYAKQRANGLYRILYEKIGVWPDGYVKIGFDNFEEVIDMLGGTEVTLTVEEAQYLNTHDYISKEEYRNVVPGTQVLNGNQTLGYCRVRYVPNCNGTKYDYGRTERQRMVLSNLFERYKDAGITKWVKILNEGLGYIETDISEDMMEELIYVVYDGRITKLEQRQIPATGTFQSQDVGKITSTLVIDWEENKEIFWSILE